PEPEVAGERSRFVAHAFLEAAVAADHEHVVVDRRAAEPLAQVRLGQSDADTVRESLSERARRHLHTRGVPVLGMTGRLRTPLPELAAVVVLDAERHEVY